VPTTLIFAFGWLIIFRLMRSRDHGQSCSFAAREDLHIKLAQPVGLNPSWRDQIALIEYAGASHSVNRGGRPPAVGTGCQVPERSCRFPSGILCETEQKVRQCSVFWVLFPSNTHAPRKPYLIAGHFPMGFYKLKLPAPFIFPLQTKWELIAELLPIRSALLLSFTNPRRR